MSHHAEIASFDAATGHYALVLADEPGSVALRIDLKRIVQTPIVSTPSASASVARCSPVPWQWRLRAASRRWSV